MIIPGDKKKLAAWAVDVIEQCRASQGVRAAQARSQRAWIYTGSADGDMALYNRLYPHLDRMASYLFSPSDLRFSIDFENHYDKIILNQADMASRVLTREFERRDIDLQFAEAVFTSLCFGSAIPKMMFGYNGVTCKLVMPWQFSVYREDLEGLESQEAVVETSYITPFDLWRRISHLPDAEALYKRATSAARKTNKEDDGGSFFHNMLLAGTQPMVQTAAPFSTQPGGFIDVSAAQTGPALSPEVVGDLIAFHELWVIDDERQDYTTIQICEPDILIAPQYRHKNMFVADHLPYSLVQPNRLSGYFWGRSEIADLIKLQHLLKDRLEDLKRLMSLQYDRMLVFTGFSGMNDEAYDQFRSAGWLANSEPGGKVEDLTPQLPSHAFDEINQIIRFMDDVSGFNNILSGQGEPGVRAGVHASTLIKTASPRLRDRALLVERQCASLADKMFQLMAAKVAKQYWTQVDDPSTDFLLSQLPEDYRISVDSHSSSPIYEEDHKEIAAFLAKLGVVDGESILDLLPIPGRDALKLKFRDAQKAKMEMIREHPELLTQHKGKKT